MCVCMCVCMYLLIACNLVYSGFADRESPALRPHCLGVSQWSGMCAHSVALGSASDPGAEEVSAAILGNPMRTYLRARARVVVFGFMCSGFVLDLRLCSVRGFWMQWPPRSRRCSSPLSLLAPAASPSPAAARGLRPLHVGARPSASGPSGPWMSAARPSGLGASGRAVRAFPFSGALRSPVQPPDAV
jgi:hypothetical protein